MDTIYRIGNSIMSIFPNRASTVVEEVNEIILSNFPGVNFVRLGGISGALAVGMAAIGSHVIHTKTKDMELRHIFDTGSSMHLLHSVVLLSMPLTKRPHLTGSFLTIGMILFSGTCYYHALTGDKRLRVLTPYGGMLLIISWLSIAV